jgi:hypothetical protein
LSAYSLSTRVARLFANEKQTLYESESLPKESVMNLSFRPGDLHLSKSGSGVFVVRVAGQDILSTKSRRAALAKFNTLRAEFEKKPPTRAFMFGTPSSSVDTYDR